MKKLLFTGLAAAGLALFIGTAAGQMAPFGNDEDKDYASVLWKVLETDRLIGNDAINTVPYEGIEPHGFVLETLISKATVNGHTGDVVVKRNYGPEGVEVDAVKADRTKHLKAITVMFRREAGFDSDNQDWFWVKYLPDGTLDKNPKGMALAGKIAKGSDAGCIACHVGADGDDYLFVN
jgi:hypothetical protein